MRGFSSNDEALLGEYATLAVDLHEIDQYGADYPREFDEKQQRRDAVKSEILRRMRP